MSLVPTVVREYPVKWGYLSNFLAVPAASAFVDVVYTRMAEGEYPSLSMLAAGGFAGLLAFTRVVQIWLKHKDPAITPSITA